MSISTPLSTYRGASPALEIRVWNLAMAFQEVFTAVVRLRYNRQAVPNADAFRAGMKQALRKAEQEALSGGYGPEDVKRAIYAVVAFLDESALGSSNPAFKNWASQPLQAELYGNLLAGETFFKELQKVLSAPDSPQLADLLEIYYLCLLLGFKGRYAAGGSLATVIAATKEKIHRVRGGSLPLSPRGGIPPESVRLSGVDPWIKTLAIVAVCASGIAVVLFVLYRFLLASGISNLPASAALLR